MKISIEELLDNTEGKILEDGTKMYYGAEVAYLIDLAIKNNIEDIKKIAEFQISYTGDREDLYYKIRKDLTATIKEESLSYIDTNYLIF